MLNRKRVPKKKERGMFTVRRGVSRRALSSSTNRIHTSSLVFAKPIGDYRVKIDKKSWRVAPLRLSDYCPHSAMHFSGVNPLRSGISGQYAWYII